jgi:hypothetical protein
MDKRSQISTDMPSISDQNEMNCEVVSILNIDWAALCDSRVVAKTKDGIICGNVVDDYNDGLVLINFGLSSWHEYLIPKSKVQGYDGKLLHLNIGHEVLTTYVY